MIQRRTRSLVVPFGTQFADFYQENTDGRTLYRIDADNLVVWDFTGSQVTDSEGHVWRTRDKNSSLQDIGGDFYSQRKYLASGPPAQRKLVHRWNDSFAKRTWTMKSPLTACNPGAQQYPDFIPSSNADLDKKGAVAVSRCSPTNSVADAAVAVGEVFKDGLPKLINPFNWESKLKLFKSLGDEFLNVQFGWLPFISDIRKTAEAARRVNRALAQFERDAGRNVRRNYHFPTTRSIDVTRFAPDPYLPHNPYYGQQGLGWVGDIYGTEGALIRTRETVRKTWFSGAFTYHMPSGYDSRNAMDRAGLAAKLVFGADLTPQTLWEMAPWSWAVDWVTNAQEVLSNLSAHSEYGQVLRYGYIMEHSMVKDTYTYEIGPTAIKSEAIPVDPVVIVAETKIRRKANPYGFGVTWEGLSPIQGAILAALGISRS